IVRPVGIASSASRLRTCALVVLWTSTVGDKPLTVTVSSRAPTFSSLLIVIVKLAGSSSPSRFTVANPVRVKVTVYTPGLRSVRRYAPVESVMAERVFSMRTGLAASTVTPGSTAPAASFTIPVRELCACAAAGSRHKSRNATTLHARCLVMTMSLQVKTPPNAGTCDWDARGFYRSTGFQNGDSAHKKDVRAAGELAA